MGPENRGACAAAILGAAVARVNPLSYVVDALRSLMLETGRSQFGLPLDLAALGLAVAVMVVVATRMYPRLTQ